MEKTLIPKEYDVKTIEHIFANAFGSPIIFTSAPTSATMKANTWGKYGSNLYIKFADGVLFNLGEIVLKSIATKTSAYTINISDYTILADVSSGAFSITLPTAIGNTGRMFVIKKMDSSANALTLATTGSETIDDDLSISLKAQYSRAMVQSDGSNWVRIG